MIRTKLFLLLSLFCASASLYAQPLVFDPKTEERQTTVNAVIGDQSFYKTHGRAPTSQMNEDLRIRTHLKYVENRLRQKEVNHLSEKKQRRRTRLLNLLREYRLQGNFPSNLRYPGRRPRFIDRKGNICAVGYLIEHTAGRELAKKVNQKYEYEYLLRMKDLPALKHWIEWSGFTKRELAMIQPSYDGMPDVTIDPPDQENESTRNTRTHGPSSQPGYRSMKFHETMTVFTTVTSSNNKSLHKGVTFRETIKRNYEASRSYPHYLTNVEKDQSKKQKWLRNQNPDVNVKKSFINSGRRSSTEPYLVLEVRVKHYRLKTDWAFFERTDKERIKKSMEFDYNSNDNRSELASIFTTLFQEPIKIQFDDSFRVQSIHFPSNRLTNIRNRIQGKGQKSKYLKEFLLTRAHFRKLFQLGWLNIENPKNASSREFLNSVLAYPPMMGVEFANPTFTHQRSRSYNQGKYKTIYWNGSLNNPSGHNRKNDRETFDQAGAIHVHKQSNIPVGCEFQIQYSGSSGNCRKTKCTRNHSVQHSQELSVEAKRKAVERRKK